LFLACSYFLSNFSLTKKSKKPKKRTLERGGMVKTNINEQGGRLRLALLSCWRRLAS